MADWWDEPYHGGGPAKVKGFPRPLYPPDAEQYGKTPSSKGPDVVAYKRTVSRLGRWPWQSFDDGYWTDFAHGETAPKTRATSGVAGVQYQQHIDATGWLGKATFDALRYALVPKELANGGEQAMDATAIEMLNEAFDMFSGHEPAPAPSSTVREAALKRARTQLGTEESPAASNRNIYGAWYGMNGVPWCAIFTTWSFELGGKDVGKDSPSFARGSKYAYVPYIVGDARANRNGLKTVDPASVQPGDVVCFDWNWDGVYDHVGIFEAWIGPSTFNAIEGNTSTSSNSNGGQVMRRARSLGQQGTVFVRVAEP